MFASLIKQFHFKRLQRATHNPAPRQQQILLDILRTNRNTEFGQAHQFSAIKSIADFRRQVPLRSSAEFGPYLKRVYQGERNILTTETPYFFAMTAGSTGDYKYIPITRRFKRELDRSVYAFYHLLETNCPEFRSAPIQFFVGSAEGGQSPGGVPQGFVSGFNYKNLPAFIRRKFVVPYWVFTQPDMDDRFYAIGRFLTAQGNLAGFGGFSPLAMMSVMKRLLANIDMLEQDVRNGTLTLNHPLAPNVYTPASLPTFKPDTALAQKISDWRNTERPLPELMQLLLPNLKYVATWMGGNMSYSTQSLLQLIGPKQVHEMPFSASEGIFGIPFRLDREGGIAAITSHFLEYIREQDIDLENPPVYCAWELEQGEHYYQIITTSGGLYRYNMEDLIRVDGFYNKTPIVQFVSKRARQISISNERINENDVTESCRQASTATGMHFNEFILFPTRANHYCLVVEENGQDLAPFAQVFESRLRDLAKVYDMERTARTLRPITLLETRQGQLRDYVNAIYFRSALPSSQYKPIHLSNSFTDADSFPVVRLHSLEI
ncbi:MAG: GH3 auxin-responsive promoter family protein [Gammaproteobacteria bacterium]|nr:GH3 auxin-responsive promoter family protein [Gammaproteobacteria bacterium]